MSFYFCKSVKAISLATAQWKIFRATQAAVISMQSELSGFTSPFKIITCK